MSRIIQDVEIEYLGKTYTCKPDFKFIDHVEKKVKFLKILQEIQDISDCKLTDIVWIIFSALKRGGVNCTFDEFGDEYMQNMEYFNEILADIIAATFPKQKNEDEDNKKKS